MTPEHSFPLEWFKAISAMIVSWPVVGLIALLIFKRPVHKLLEQFTSGDVHTVKLGTFELQREVRKLAAKTDTLATEVDDASTRVSHLFVASMSPLALQNLRKIASRNFGKYFRGQGLTWQLLYFASVGYITFKVSGIDQIPPDGENPPRNLSDFVEITPFGLEYLDLRERFERTTPPLSHASTAAQPKV